MTNHLDIEYVPVDDLEEWPGNARVGDVERIKVSMRQHGVFNPVIVQRSTNRVMIGNHRIAALRQLHDEDPKEWDGLAPVIYYDVDDTQGTKINLIDNKLADDATMDDEALAAQLQAIQDETGDLSGTGYIEDELTDILNHLNPSSLDDLASEYGEPNDEDLWPTFSVKLNPDTMRRFTAYLEGYGGETVAEQIDNLLADQE